MGQKSHPIGIRLGINKTWKSNWITSGKNFKKFLHEDFQIRNYLENKLKDNGIADIVIERNANQVIITIETSRPGVIIGRGGAGIEELKSKIEKMTKNSVKINIQEAKNPETSAALIGQNVASQIEKRISWRRAVKQAISRAKEARVSGIRIAVSGRLGGIEMARTEKFSEGRMPLQTLKADINYSLCKAKTTYGVIGVKTWVFQEKKEKQGVK